MANAKHSHSQEDAGEAEKEKKRQVSLRNLKEKSLQDLAVAYHVHKDKNFGESDNSAVEQFKYRPAMGNTKYHTPEGKEGNLVTDSLLNSRTDGERYSGSISELGIMKSCAGIIQGSLMDVKVGDILGLMGSDKKYGYSDMYISDLAQSENADMKKIAQAVMTSYMGYTVSKGVSDAYSQVAGATKKGLESILTKVDEEADEAHNKRK